jgi:RNA polymerase sigma-70 factor, ECF subfamily
MVPWGPIPPTFRARAAQMRERPLSATIAPTLVPAGKRIGINPNTLPTTATVDELARAACAGDADAVGRLYDELVTPMYRYVIVRVRRREDAEDITHQIFERIVAALPRYRDNGRPFSAWAFRIARNAVIDHVRRVRPLEPLESAPEPRDEVGLEQLTVRGEQIRELRLAIRELTPDQQEALALRYAAGLSAEEAAKAMGRRAGTIRGLTFRAIEALRRKLGTEGES